MRLAVAAVIISLLVLPASVVCKKGLNNFEDCFTNEATTRIITNKPATIRLIASNYYIIESGAIDGKLNPCYLEIDFQIDGLPVFVSGEVKEPSSISSLCCVENFIITDITR